MFEIDNQRLYNENDQLKQIPNHSSQRSNVIISNLIRFFLIPDLFSSQQFSNQK
jgi:hypothetical protein